MKDGSRAIGNCEPCQVGNQAALSSPPGVPRGCLSGAEDTVTVWKRFVQDTMYGSLPDTRNSFKTAVHGCRSLGNAPSCALFFREVFMHRALYRTWRPGTFDDVVGQTHITDILKYQVQENKTSHAYLFCGSRGTGKTTCAKILAKAVNCLHPVNGNPCNACEACRSIDSGTATDVLEMDAASNNGVDNVRDLKEEIAFMPATLKRRVYIIDEVHMMSPSAFNALLKTLEEPPSYVLFILATTELHKLPSTIISRCQRYDFRRISTDVIMERLETIAQHEGMTLLADGARMIARSAQGGMRDAISMLELCGSANAPIDETLASEMLGVGNRDTLFRVLEAILQKDYATLYGVIDDIVMSSGNLGVFWTRLGDIFRDMMVFLTAPDARAYLDVTDSEYQRMQALSSELTVGKLYYMSKLIDDTLPELQRSGLARRSSVEIALTRMCDPRTYAVPEALLARVEELERTVRLLQIGGPVPPPAQDTPHSSQASPIAPQEGKVAKEASPTPTTPTPPPQAKKTQAPPSVPSVAVPQETERRVVAGWRDLVEEFSRLFSYYTGIFKGSRGFVLGETLVVQMQDQFLIPTFEADKKGTDTLLHMASEKAGTSLSTLKIEKTKTVPDSVETTENMF